MGVYYDLYAEVLFNGAWINIDSRIQGLDGKLHHSSVVNGQSWLREALEIVSDEIYSIPFEKLTEDTREIFVKSYGNEYSKNITDQTFKAFDFQTAVKDRIKDSPTMRCYANRTLISMFKTGEINSIEDWLLTNDYVELDKEEQKEYTYFEWDDRDGWYDIFKKIAARVEFLVESFNDLGIPYEMCKDLDERRIKSKDVRLVIVGG